jgi:hypothetical protein
VCVCWFVVVVVVVVCLFVCWCCCLILMLLACFSSYFMRTSLRITLLIKFLPTCSCLPNYYGLSTMRCLRLCVCLQLFVRSSCSVLFCFVLYFFCSILVERIFMLLPTCQYLSNYDRLPTMRRSIWKIVRVHPCL